MEIYITSGGDTLTSLLHAHYGDLSPDDYHLKQHWTIEANPWLNHSGHLPPNRLLLLPAGPQDLICTPEWSQVRSSWDALNEDGKTFVKEALRRNEPGFLEALDELLIEYQVINSVGYVNTFAAGAVGGSVQRATHLGETLARVETVLREYGAAHSLEKNALKPRVRAAYAQLDSAFKNDLAAASTKLKAKGRLGPLFSPRQGMQRAQRLAQQGSRAPILGGAQQVQRIMKVAQYGKVLGKGMIVLDLGIRAHNVATSNNQLRTGVSEAAGFGLSFGAGAVAYKACLAPAAVFTGPWALAVCLLPAGGAALLFDEMGKKIGTAGYDAAIHLSQ